MEAYLARLPRGRDSFEDCTTKGALLRACLQARPLGLDQLPENVSESIRELIRSPPLDSSWFPTVDYFGTSMVIADAYDMSDAEFCRFWYEVMRDLSSSRLYSLLLGVATPDRLLKYTGLGWGRFHRGWTMRTSERDGDVEIVLEFPAGLLPPLGVRGFASVFQAFIDASSAPGGVVEAVSSNETTATYRCSGWR